MLEAYLLTYGSFFLWPGPPQSYSPVSQLIGIELLFSLINGAGKPNDLPILPPPSRIVLLHCSNLSREKSCTYATFNPKSVEREIYRNTWIKRFFGRGKLEGRTKVKSVIAPTFAQLSLTELTLGGRGISAVEKCENY